MARDILAVPIADVGCKCIFSEARDVVTYRRNWLNSSTVSNIMISKLHWKNSRNEMSFISDVADEENVEELMAEKEDAQLAEMFGFSDVEDTAVDEDDYNSADEFSARGIGLNRENNHGKYVHVARKRRAHTPPSPCQTSSHLYLLTSSKKITIS